MSEKPAGDVTEDLDPRLDPDEVAGLRSRNRLTSAIDAKASPRKPRVWT